MKKTHFKLVIFAFVVLALGLTVTPAWAGLITPEAWSATGESSANYGLAERLAIGDFNGDTYPDIAAADRNHNGGAGAGAGAVFVWYGSASGFGAAGTPANADWIVQGEVPALLYDQFGSQMAVADFNKDTYDDVAVGCLFCDEGNSAEGAVYVYFGSSSGLPVNPTKANADWMAHTAQNDAMMGQGDMIAGDVNNDTYPDLIVGNTTYDNGNTNEGAVFVWYGGSSGFGATGTPANADWIAESNLHVGVLGSSLAAGDVNGDTYTDLAVGRTDSGNSGHVYLWYGTSSGLGPHGTIANSDWEAASDQENCQFGKAGTLVMADFDGSGHADLAVGASGYDGPLSMDEGMGYVFIWEGSATGLGADGTPANADWVAHGESGYAGLGRMVTAGDLSGDGYADLSVIQRHTTPHVLAWYGSNTGLGADGTPANADDTLNTDGNWLTVGQALGSSTDDLLLVDNQYGGNPYTGKLYVYQTDAPPLNPTSVTETGRTQESVWQNAVSDPAFTWSGASDDSAVDGYYVYFGADPQGTDTIYVSIEAYDPPAVSDGEHYLRISTQDDGGNQAPWETLFTFRYDGTHPTNPTSATEMGGAQDDTWQNGVNDPAFTWSGASDAHSGIDRYNVYFGDDPSGTSGIYTTSAAYNPAAVVSGVYYLRVRTQDNAGNLAGWETLFTFRYDGTNPSNPTSATETGGAPHDVWQNTVDDPDFTWSWAADAHSGIAGYLVYFGSNPTGTSSTFTTSANYNPGAVSSGTYYLRVSTLDYAGNQASWETLFTFRYDDTVPGNPTGIVELDGALSAVWQNNVNDPSFTWTGAIDAHSGVDGYFVYFGDDPAGTGTDYVTEAAYNPPAVASGTYYLRISTQDNVGHQTTWETLFTFQYDPILPLNPEAATELGGAQDNVWQGEVSDPSFDWSGATDVPSGVNGYFVYFGADPNGAAGTYVFEPTYNPPEVPKGVYYLRVRTQDEAENQAAWETLFTFRYKTALTLFLPLIGYSASLIPSLNETEPNNLFEEANLVNQLPIQIKGNHDGATGTGDVFRLDDNLMTAGEVVQATIDTENTAGLQLVVYDPQGQEIARAYDGAFVVSFIVPTSGTYYVYVYTDPGADNRAAYELLIEILP